MSTPSDRLPVARTTTDLDDLSDPKKMPDDELDRLIERFHCSELTCPYHGPYLREALRRRHTREEGAWR